MTDKATVHAHDNEANDTSDFDTATVTIDNVNPTISVTKTAGTAADGVDFHINEPGGPVTFTVKVKNTSVSTDPVTLSSLTDDIYGNLDKDDVSSHTWTSSTCDTGGTINPGATYTCTFTGNVTGDDSRHSDTVSSLVRDNENNPASASDVAVVVIDNVRPTVVITGPASVNESTVDVTYSFDTTDPGTADTFTAGTPSCGTSGTYVSGSIVFDPGQVTAASSASSSTTTRPTRCPTRRR